jgi:hypothetical protein
MTTDEEAHPMTALLLAEAPPADLTPEFQQMLGDIDERVDAVDLSSAFAASLTRAEWLALRDVLLRNDVTLRIQ